MAVCEYMKRAPAHRAQKILRAMLFRRTERQLSVSRTRFEPLLTIYGNARAIVVD